MRIHPTMAPCDLCGCPAAANWGGPHGQITICATCAPEALPGLLADAIALPVNSGDQAAKEVEQRILANFWRALSKRLLGERAA